jgi:hypothetical protein
MAKANPQSIERGLASKFGVITRMVKTTITTADAELLFVTAG